VNACGRFCSISAIRELREELGLEGELVFGAKLPAGPQTAFEHTVLYHLQTDSTPTPDSSEISSIAYLSTAVIAEMLQNRPQAFTPPFRELFQLWWDEEQATALPR